ncbi:SNF1 protein kinase subunit beta-3 [Cytospora mali]|uniref:SNF1 protein kinase subunit beta-3 n=1 Tax=Cytospora mali TaxID=578113 RepID=A0A194V4R0_CYTMA|nr:SNF1 protein kinase subunit beta-3 [Valsa mali var. pyri (nom. inval.)]
MGNNPSTSKQETPTPSSGSARQPQHSYRDHHYQKSTSSSRPPLGMHNHGAAAPAQASLALAQGSTDIKNSQALPITSLAASPAGSTKSGTTTLLSRPTDSKLVLPVPVPASRDRLVAETAPSKPVDVPNPNKDSAAVTAATAPAEPTSPLSPFDSSDGIYPQGSVSDMSFISRPPRMPLPIEEEVHTPGSPIIAPADMGGNVDAVDLSGEDSSNMARKSSTLSTTTVDDDDSDELRVDKTRPTVPTRLEWRRGGERVYVTGTIFQWNRKQRLHPVEGQPGVFATTINVLPGTHHVRFLVDNNMQTSPDLPTTVDFGNNLVNYIEISPDDVPAAPQEEESAATPQERKDRQLAAEAKEEEAKQRRDKQVLPAEAFSAVWPQYLYDYENEPEDSPVAQAAAAAIEKLPNPPSLPGFLSKPILNAATLMKDDNSVLNMPNHTTLNHLATSSIKNGTLAVSATTRYRDKYVTTIMYKPVPGHD